MGIVVIKIRRTFLQQVGWVLLQPLRLFRKWIIKKLLGLRAKLQLGSLRHAIQEADENKEETGRKNIVVFNATSGKYEPVQKKLLKAAAGQSRNKSNKAMTDGRKRELAKTKSKKRPIDQERIKQIEKKSLYVTE